MKKEEYKTAIEHIRIINEIDKILELDIDYYYQAVLIKDVIEKWRKDK